MINQFLAELDKGKIISGINLDKHLNHLFFMHTEKLAYRFKSDVGSIPNNSTSYKQYKENAIDIIDEYLHTVQVKLASITSKVRGDVASKLIHLTSLTKEVTMVIKDMLLTLKKECEDAEFVVTIILEATQLKLSGGDDVPFDKKRLAVLHDTNHVLEPRELRQVSWSIDSLKAGVIKKHLEGEIDSSTRTHLREMYDKVSELAKDATDKFEVKWETFFKSFPLNENAN